MSRTQKRLSCSSEKENKTLNSLCGCCSFMHCVFFHTDLLFPCLKLWIALTCSAWPIPPPFGVCDTPSLPQPILKEAARCPILLEWQNSNLPLTVMQIPEISRLAIWIMPYSSDDRTLWKASCTLLYVQLSHTREQQIIQSFVSLFLPKKVESTYIDIYLSVCCTHLSRIPTDNGCYRGNLEKGSRELWVIFQVWGQTQCFCLMLSKS